MPHRSEQASLAPHVTKLLPERPDGTSKARWCQCDDGVERLVKWHKSGPKTMYHSSHGPKTCFNEFVASRLGLLIGAPVLRTSVIFVPPSVIEEHDWHEGAVPGFQCGITRISGRDVPG